MLDNDIALVTGASRGIGRAIALELARQGACVIGTATTAQGAEGIDAAFAEIDARGAGRALDVTDADAVDTLIAQVAEAFGPPSILVNNAAITRDNLLLRMKPEEWDEVIATNLSSVYRTSRAVLRGMVKARRGRIISIGSVVGSMGNAGQTNYAAAKAGLGGFSRALAREVGARGITVNVVAPGFVDTAMTRALPEQQRQALLGQVPLGRLGTPEDVAGVVAFLASPMAAYVTGETLHVNGGLHMV